MGSRRAPGASTHGAITQTATSTNGPYLAQFPGIQDTEDGSGNVKACTYSGYDGGTVGADNSVSTLTQGLETESTRYASNCTPGSLSGPVSTLRTYNGNGDLLATEDADALAGISGHVTDQCRFNSVNYTACATYDSVYESQVASVKNVKNQTTSLGYLDTSSSSTTPDAVNGWGQWLTSMTDANGQKTQYEYDPLGRLSATAQPGDSYGSPTTSYGYPDTCAPTGAQEPCIALTTTQRQDSSATYQSATYYNGWGWPVETVKPQSVSGSTCIFSVSFTVYDGLGQAVFQSDPYFEGVGNDAGCVPVYLRPDTSQPGVATSYDGLGRVISKTDALSHTTTTVYTPGRPTPGANITDTAIYEATQVTDANSHTTRTLTDGLGQTRYVEQFTGTGVPGDQYALYGTTQSNYDYLGDVTSVYEPTPSGSAGLGTTAQTQTTYNLIKQATVVVDADRGRMTAAYDPNGNVTVQTDPRGASGTVYLGYDGLNRLLWQNTSNSPTGAFLTNTYDETSGHGDGVGRLTTSAYTNSGGGRSVSLTGSHAYTYDGRGQVTSQTDSITGHPFTFGMSYNDAGQPSSLTYSDNEVLSYGYNSYGWLTSLVTTPSGQGSTTLLTNITYTGNAGAAGHPTGASVGNGTYTDAATYDADLRLTSETLTNTSLGTTLYQSVRGYDAVSNVTSVDTTLATGTDNQVFCYDALNRLVWAGSTGAPSCGGSISAGCSAPRILGLPHVRCRLVGGKEKRPTGEGHGSAGAQNPLVHTFGA